ncbi:MAG: hypothetical protein ACR2OC_10855 [Solirubrobacterales bacterium]
MIARTEVWARAHPWPAAYIVVFVPILLVMVIAKIAGWADSAVVIVALCAVAIGGFVLDELKNGRHAPAEPAEPQSSQRAQTE